MNWNQFRTILWLRWRLSRNQLGRAGVWNAVLTIFAVVCGVTFAVGGCVGGFFAGYVGLAGASSQTVVLAWDAGVGLFLFFWMFGIVAEIQRSESVDLARLLHLPVRLRDIFLVNYVASHLTLSIILVVPAMLGLAAGLSAGRGFLMLLLFPLVFSFIFMISAWTYCLRGWLAALMINPRRRRAIIIGITTAFILLGQLPNLYFNIARNDDRRRSDRPQTGESNGPSAITVTDGHKKDLPAAVLAAHTYIPVLWVGKGAMELDRGRAWPAILGSAAAMGLGALGLRRAYLATVRFYLGQSDGARATPGPVSKAPRRRGRDLLERQLPGVPEEATALALASFRSMTRAPEVRMALASSLIMLLVFGTMFFSRASKMPPENSSPFIVTGAVAFVMLGMVQLLFNQFGFDRDGFRSLVLLPTRRRQILLGKNLAFLPIVAGSGIILLVAVKIAVGVSVGTIFAGTLQLAAAFLLVCIAGNLVSILAPYRIAGGSLKATKTPLKTTLVIFLSHLLFPIAIIPTFIPPFVGWVAGVLAWVPSVPVNLLLSVILVAACVLAYRLSLDGLGDLLQRREVRMLHLLTHDVE